VDFASDNWAGASDRIVAALAQAARRGGIAYGGDDVTAKANRAFAEVFDHDVDVHFVATGTAANALALSAYARPGGVVFCHADAHVLSAEGGAVEFLSGGRVVGIAGAAGKITGAALTAAMAPFDGQTHHGLPAAASITEISELGAVYAPDEIAAVAEAAHARGAALHMDGARFANAVAALGVAPAELTWRAGVDAMSFGGTKNGCLQAEAVIFFGRERRFDFPHIRQRAGHGFSKNWVAAAQFTAYLADGHWLELARHANAAGKRLAAAIARSRQARLLLPAVANEVFAILSADLDRRLKAADAAYYPWGDASAYGDRIGAGEVLARFVTSFATTDAELDQFAAIVAA
jgi:threonine aldolase